MSGAGWKVAAMVALSVVLSGCGSTHTMVPFVRAGGGPADMKMLRPGLHARACRVWLLGIPLGTADAADELVGTLMASDAEGDVLANVRVTTSGVMTGVFNRMCVEVTGDLGREISVVRLPAVGGGHDHH